MVFSSLGISVVRATEIDQTSNTDFRPDLVGGSQHGSAGTDLESDAIESIVAEKAIVPRRNEQNGTVLDQKNAEDRLGGRARCSGERISHSALVGTAAISRAGAMNVGAARRTLCRTPLFSSMEDTRSSADRIPHTGQGFKS